MKRLVFLLTFLCWTTQGESQTLAEDFGAAQQALVQGQYTQAIDLYLELIQQHGVSAPVLYNLANSYALNGEIGFAILYYERALQVAPGDADIRANLEQVRKDAGLYRDDRPFYERIIHFPGPDQWLLLSLGAFVFLALTVLTAALRSNISLPHVHLCLWVFISLTLLPLPLAYLGYQTWQQGVVIVEDARLLLSPFAESASLGSIQAGRLVRPEQEHEGYIFVRDELGRSGWLEQTSFQALLEKAK
jgi:tetratricopeptide (TPR) repeat protein